MLAIWSRMGPSRLRLANTLCVWADTAIRTEVARLEPQLASDDGANAVKPSCWRSLGGGPVQSGLYGFMACGQLLG